MQISDIKNPILKKLFEEVPYHSGRHYIYVKRRH